MDKLWKRYGLFAVLTALLTAFDQWTKALAYNGLRTGGPIVIWNGVFELLYSENRGAAFGILQESMAFSFSWPVRCSSLCSFFLPGSRGRSGFSRCLPAWCFSLPELSET